MKKKNFTVEETISSIIEESNKVILNTYKETVKSIRKADEKEFLKSLEGKYLVLQRGKMTFYCGKIKSAVSSVSIESTSFSLKYILKVTYARPDKDVSVYINPITKNYKIFDTETDAKKYLSGGKE